MANHDGTPPAGPLTTVFTPAASCAAHTDGLYWISTCMMSGWQSYSTASYFSPGICPSGCTSAGTIPTDFGPPLESTETGIMCCQTGLTITSLASATLLLQFPVTEPFVYFCHTSDPALTPEVRWNYAIAVRWAETDLSVLETDPLHPGLPPQTANTVTTTETTTTTTTGTTNGTGGGSGKTGASGNVKTTGVSAGGSTENGSSGSTGSGSGSSGLSKGAIAGIVVGVVVLLIGVALGAFFLLRRRRSREMGVGAVQPYSAPPAMAAIAPKGGPAPPRPDRPPTLPQEYFMGPIELPGAMVPDRVELPGRS